MIVNARLIEFRLHEKFHDRHKRLIATDFCLEKFYNAIIIRFKNMNELVLLEFINLIFRRQGLEHCNDT